MRQERRATSHARGVRKFNMGSALKRASFEVARSVRLCYIVHMKKITLRELHIDTGKWVRSVSRDKRLIVTDRGIPIVTLVPYTRDDAGVSFSRRKLLPEFSALAGQEGDSTLLVSKDRDRS